MKLMVLDGNSIVNRAYYGIRPLTTKDGFYTHAIYGFVTMLQRFLDEEKPDALCITFDRREPTFRHLADKDYKAQRKGMPEELAMQMPVLKEVLDAMSIPMYELSGYEADDLIGTISRKCEAADWQCVIVTGDKDSLQLITDKTKVKLVSTRMGQTTTKDMTTDAFRDQYGFDPIHMIDLKALMGDTSDNISGVPGIGEKSAMALIQEYATVDAIYEGLPDIHAKPAAIRHLQEGEESARHSYWLATIKTDAPLEFNPEENLKKAFKPELYDLFLKLEFKKLIDKYQLTPPVKTEEVREEKEERVAAVMTVVTREEDAQQLLEEWRKLKCVSVLLLPDLNGVAVESDDCEKPARMTQFFFDRYEGDWNQLINAIFSEDIHKVTHNSKDLIRQLLENGYKADGIEHDVALEAYVLDPTTGGYDLDKLFLTYFNEELPEAIYQKEDAFPLLGDSAMAEANFASYCTAISALHEELFPKLMERHAVELYEKAEMPLCRVLAEMEINGFRLDGKALAQFGTWLQERIKDIETQIYTEAGGEFNINSPKQLGVVLFEQLQLPHGKKTKTGWSTNADVLEKLRYQHPVVENILTYRQLTKLKSTYADGLLKAVSPDGRVRTSFQMTVTATGRLSSTEPNLQNIPTRTELGSEIRRLFIADDGNVLVDADYSQIELRLLAHIANDPIMQEAFISGADFHTVTAAKVFGVEPDQVTSNMRRSAKAVNFGIVYGISAFSLSQDINVTVAEAKEFMERYFETYPGVRKYMTSIIEKARADGYVETMMHRRRNLPELSSSNFNMRSFGERVALNMPIQGTAADIIKMAMVNVHHRLKEEKLSARLIMQVHDELIVECPEEECEHVMRILEQEMAHTVSISVPLPAEAHSGKNWLEAKE